MSIQLKKKFSMENGNKVTKKNWQKVYATSNQPCTNVLGVPEIELTKKTKGAYHERWQLVYEPEEWKEDDKGKYFNPGGYIFREINHGCGINGRHKTFKEAIWCAMDSRISVWLEE